MTDYRPCELDDCDKPITEASSNPGGLCNSCMNDAERLERAAAPIEQRSFSWRNAKRLLVESRRVQLEMPEVSREPGRAADASLHRWPTDQDPEGTPAPKQD